MRYIIIGIFLLTAPFCVLGAEETITIRSLWPAPGGAINTTENANLAVGDDTKKVGIGTNTPQSKLDVEGGAAIGESYAGSNAAPDNGLIVEGRVGIGTPNPNVALDVIGAIQASAGLTVTGGVVSLPDGSIGSAEIADGAVTSADIAVGAVTATEIADGAVTAAKIGDQAVTAAKIHNNVAGLGLIGGNGTAFSVNVGSGIRITEDTVELAPPTSGAGTSYTCPGSITVDGLGRVTACSSGACGGGDGGETAGSGTVNYIARWTGSSSLGNSEIQQNGSSIGIGISPTEKLHVNGILRVGSTQIYDNEINRYNNDPLHIGYRNTSLTTLQLNGGRVGIGTTPDSGVTLDVNGAIRATSFSSPAGTIDGYSLDAADGSPTNAVYVDNSGNAGIGTTTPKNRLDVEGAMAVGALYSGTDAAPSQGMIVQGNVGIGTKSPAAPLHVVRLDGPLPTISNLYTSAVFQCNDAIGRNSRISIIGGNVGSSSIAFGDKDEERDGEITYRHDSRRLDFETDKTIRVTITSSGDMGIGTTSPNYKLDVRGTIGNNTTFYHSDIRWKSGVETISKALDKVLRLRGVNFQWRQKEYKDMDFASGQHIGLIAQEVEKVVPEVVSTSKEGYKSIEYANLVALLIEAIKAQQEEIEQLRAEIKNRE